MIKKYKLMVPSKKDTLNDYPVYRIKALIDIPEYNVAAGDLGGLVSSSANLSQSGSCWITKHASAFDNSRVTDDALLSGNARLLSEAFLYGSVVVTDDVIIKGMSKIGGRAKLYDRVYVSDEAYIGDDAQLFGDVVVYGNSKITGRTILTGNPLIKDRCELCDARISGQVHLFDKVKIKDAHIAGDVTLSGNVQIRNAISIKGFINITGNVVIKSDRDYINIVNLVGNNLSLCWTKSNGKWSVDSKSLSGKELIAEGYLINEQEGDRRKLLVEFVKKLQTIKKKYKKTKDTINEITTNHA